MRSMASSLLGKDERMIYLVKGVEIYRQLEHLFLKLIDTEHTFWYDVDRGKENEKKRKEDPRQSPNKSGDASNGKVSPVHLQHIISLWFCQPKTPLLTQCNDSRLRGG